MHNTLVLCHNSNVCSVPIATAYENAFVCMEQWLAARWLLHGASFLARSVTLIIDMGSLSTAQRRYASRGHNAAVASNVRLASRVNLRLLRP